MTQKQEMVTFEYHVIQFLVMDVPP